MRPEDVNRVAALHLEALPHGLFPSLGPRFLARYHRTFLTSPFGSGWIIDHGGVVTGFIAGTFDQEAHQDHVIRRDGTRLVTAASLALSRRPATATRFVRTRSVRYARKLVRVSRTAPPQRPPPPAGAPPAPPAGGWSGVLAHIAVDPAWRSNGSGTRLTRAFASWAELAGAAEVRLSTLAGPGGAGAFYERLGWTASEVVEDADQVAWTRYRLVLR